MKCIKCKEDIHPLRLKALPNTKVCVSCSSTKTYRAISQTHGEGDHTWNDIQIVSGDDLPETPQIDRLGNEQED